MLRLNFFLNILSLHTNELTGSLNSSMTNVFGANPYRVYDNELFVCLDLDVNGYFIGFKFFLTAFHMVFRLLSELNTS